MPKFKSKADTRISDLKKMSGAEWAMEVATDLVILSQTQRAQGLRMLQALNETINRETAALAAG